jgi:putative nucleotidyltransferase with HDIG domain
VTTFLLESSARKVFESRDQHIAEACRAVWEHSVAVALVTREVVTFSNGSDPELGYLAGLLHDVGKPVVAAMLLEAEKSVLGNKPMARWIQSSSWIQVIQRVHRRVGVELAERWQLPEAIRDAIRDCAEYDSANRESAANAVRFANALVKRAGIYAGEVATDDVEALIMIGRSLLQIDDGVTEKLTFGLRERVQQQIA